MQHYGPSPTLAASGDGLTTYVSIVLMYDAHWDGKTLCTGYCSSTAHFNACTMVLLMAVGAPAFAAGWQSISS